MASRFYGINRGQYYNQVVDGTSTGSKDVELRWDTGKNLTVQDVQHAVEQILLWLINGGTNVGGTQDFGSNNL